MERIEKHFTATGVVLDGRGRTLLIKHKKLGIWLCPGGHIEPNETPDEAVLREIWEETGVKCCILPNGECHEFADRAAAFLATPRHVLLEDIGFTGKHMHVDLVYYCLAESGEPIANQRETAGIGWFTKEQLTAIHTYENVRSILIHAIETCGQ